LVYKTLHLGEAKVTSLQHVWLESALSKNIATFTKLSIEPLVVAVCYFCSNC